MFRILLFSAFCLLLAAIGKFLFMDDYLPADARRGAVSAALPGASGLTDRHRDAADLFASAQSGGELDSLFEDALPAERTAANLDAEARAIARDLLGSGVDEPRGAAALPNADDGAAAQQEASTGGTAAETAGEPQAPVSSFAVESAVTVAPAAPVDENTALPSPAVVAQPAGRSADGSRGESKPRVAAAAGAASSAATPRKPSKENAREGRGVEKRPAAAVAARSPAPKQVAKPERSKPVAARDAATPRREGQSAGRAAVAQSSKAGRAYQARVSMPVGRSDRKLMARLEQETRGAPARSKSEPAKRRNTSTGGGMARSTSGTDGDEIVSRWVGSVATGVQRLMGHELNSVTKPRSVVGYCRSQPDSWVFDEGRKQMVYCGEVAAARSSVVR